MTAKEPIAVLPQAKFQARKHHWDHEQERFLAATNFPDGNDRNEKPCIFCGMWKITVHYRQGFPTHEWRTRTGQIWHGESTPPCIPNEGEK